jgi:hypothetical protein
MNNPQDIAVLEEVTDILDRLNIAYAIGGSFASSAYGAVRFTQDADITVEPFTQISDKFFDVIKNNFYISKETMSLALQNRTSFNVIHFATAFKIDIFIRKDNAFQIQMFSHTRKLPLGENSKQVSFVSPEDIILLKLDWSRQSEGSSERQLSDIKSVLTAQKETLDFEYLTDWAKKLGLSELLKKAISESDLP